MIGANSSANSFRTLFGMLSGPTDLLTWSNDNALYASFSVTRNSCGTSWNTMCGVKGSKLSVSPVKKLLILLASNFVSELFSRN